MTTALIFVAGVWLGVLAHMWWSNSRVEADRAETALERDACDQRQRRLTARELHWVEQRRTNAARNVYDHETEGGDDAA